MRRLYSWTAGLVGIAALARVLARRARVEQPALPPPGPRADDPAAELRRKLDQARDLEPPSAEGPPEPPGPEEPLAERRARVHAKAQEALAAMDALEEPPA